MKKKKNKSQIQRPKQPTKTTPGIMGFRPDREIAMLLQRAPNKSETITTALREYFAQTRPVTCPQCNGRGKIMKKRK